MTGMSGTGKSSALERLRLLGFRTVDTDEGDWTYWCGALGAFEGRQFVVAMPMGHRLKRDGDYARMSE